MSFVAFFCFLVGLFLAGLVLWFHPRSHRNRAMAVAALIYAWWSFCFILVYGADNMADAFFWYQLSVSGILFLIPAFYWTYLDQAGLAPRLRAVLMGALVLANAYVYVRSWQEGFFLAEFRWGPWGNVGIPNPAPYQFGYGFYLALTVVMVGAILYYRHRATSNRLRSLFTANALGIVGTSILSVVAVILETALQLPPLELVVCGLYLVGFNFYLMGHYRYLRPSPIWGAKHSVTYLSDAACLLDEDLKIVGYNQSAARLLGQGSLDQKPFASLFDDQKLPDATASNLAEMDHHLVLRRRDQGFRLQLTSHFDRFGDFSGATVVLRPLLAEFSWPANLELSDREAEIATLVLQGSANKTIAATLHISEGTVKNHIYSIYRKCRVNSRLELINKYLPKP